MALRQPKKDYLAEMKRCTYPKCRKLKALSEFNKFGERLHSWCKACQNKNTAERQQEKRNEKLAEEKLEKVRRAILRKETLSQPSFIYQNGYTLNVIPIHENFKIELCDGQEEMAVLLPVGRAELLKDWLVIKLKEKNNERI